MEYMKNSNPTKMRVQTTVCNKQVVTESACELSLPDYRPEVKRLLRVRATVMPPEKYLGASGAELSGHVEYSILYAGNDGKLYCVTHTDEYRMSVPLELAADVELGEGLICSADVTSESCNGRVFAPRKLSLKCRLRAHVRVWGVLTAEDCPAQSEDVLRLCGNTEVACIFLGASEDLSLGDEIVCDQDSDDLRVICADGEVYVNDVSVGSGSVTCRGEVILKLLCAHDESNVPPSSMIRRIPFQETVPTEGAEVNCHSTARGVCSAVNVTVEDGRILCDVTVRLETFAQRNEPLSYTRDAYSTTRQTVLRTERRTLLQARTCSCTNFSLNTTLPLTEIGLREGQTIVDLTLAPSVSELTSHGIKDILSGRCRAHAILCDGEGELSAQEFEIPFRYEIEGSALPIADHLASVTPITCRARSDGERIGIDAELCVLLFTRNAVEVERICECNFGEPLAPLANAAYTVAYPCSGESLWSLAKRYHRSIPELIATNALPSAPAADSPESLAAVPFVLL